MKKTSKSTDEQAQDYSKCIWQNGGRDKAHPTGCRIAASCEEGYRISEGG